MTESRKNMTVWAKCMTARTFRLTAKPRKKNIRHCAAIPLRSTNSEYAAMSDNSIISNKLSAHLDS
jgi:hypothetical protein